jgi:hypothetical protein
MLAPQPVIIRPLMMRHTAVFDIYAARKDIKNSIPVPVLVPLNPERTSIEWEWDCHHNGVKLHTRAVA